MTCIDVHVHVFVNIVQNVCIVRSCVMFRGTRHVSGYVSIGIVV